MSNVKNAPAGTYFTEYGYSQCYPWVLVEMSKTGKTAVIRPVRTKSDPEWIPNMSVGGFCGHCHNQRDQTWLYDGVEERTIRIRRDKHGKWVNRGVRFAEADGPFYFYDYNF